jgi:hypothetical protein
MKKTATLIGLILVLAASLFADSLVWKTGADFNRNFNWNVSYKKGLQLNGFESYGKYSIPAVAGTSIEHVYQDPVSGTLLLSDYYDNNGLTLIFTNGTSITYRTDGVYDTTSDFMGTKIANEPTIPTNMVLNAVVDPDTGDIYASGYGYSGLFVIHSSPVGSTNANALGTTELLSGQGSPLLTYQPYEIALGRDHQLLLGGSWDTTDKQITLFDTRFRTSTLMDESGIYEGNTGTPILLSNSPRLGKWQRYASIIRAFQDEDGRLIVGSNGSGLTIYNLDPIANRFTSSRTFRSTGVYDTTDSPEGVLINSESKLTSDDVTAVAEDASGNLYVASIESFSSGGVDKIGSDGSITKLPNPLTAYPWDISFDSKNNLYVSYWGGGGGIQVIKPDGSQTNLTPETAPYVPKNVWKTWFDGRGSLHMIGQDCLNVLAPGGKVIRGKTESKPISLLTYPVSSATFKASGNKPKTTVHVQLRSGDANAFFEETFDSSAKLTIRADQYSLENGTLLVSMAKQRRFTIDFGFPDGFFPPGSRIKMRARVSTSSDYFSARPYVDDWDWGQDDNSAAVREPGVWTDLIFAPSTNFSTVGFYGYNVTSVEIDSIEILRNTGWSEWQEIMPGKISARPGDEFIQWRALFEGLRGSAPVLKSLTLN